MTYNPGSGAAVAAHQHAIANAIKASGAIVKLKPAEFAYLLNKADNPLVVYCETRFLGRAFKYLFNYRGLICYTKSPLPLEMPSGVEMMQAKEIWIPA